MLISWIIVGVMILVILFFLKFKHFGHRTLIVILLIMILFVYLTASRIVSENNVNMKSFDGVVQAGKLYFSWLGQVGGNLKSLTGNAIRMDWGGNSTSK
jgi:hypothetical protein